MRKSNNYYKFMEYVSYGKRCDDTICKDNGVLECTSYCTVSDIEYYENTTLGVENDWLTIKNVLVNEEVIYVYHVKGESTFYIDTFILDNFKTQKELKYAIHKAVDKFFINNVDIITETSEIEDLDEYEDIIENEDLDEIIENENLDEAEETKTTEEIPNDKKCTLSYCCPADRKYNRCGGTRTCRTTWERYKAIVNPEWHHVSLDTLANLDFDMLDEKRQIYLSAYRDLKQTLSYLRKCKTQDTYDICFIRYTRRKNMLWDEGKISDAMWKYIEVKLSMQNVESGVWASKCEDATGHHESRRYNKSRA